MRIRTCLLFILLIYSASAQAKDIITPLARTITDHRSDFQNSPYPCLKTLAKIPPEKLKPWLIENQRTIQPLQEALPPEFPRSNSNARKIQLEMTADYVTHETRQLADSQSLPPHHAFYLRPSEARDQIVAIQPEGALFDGTRRTPGNPKHLTLDSFLQLTERKAIRNALDAVYGNQTEAARLLRLCRHGNGLYTKITSHGLQSRTNKGLQKKQPRVLTLDQFIHFARSKIIRQTLHAANNHQTKAARWLGVSRQTLCLYLKRHCIPISTGPVPQISESAASSLPPLEMTLEILELNYILKILNRTHYNRKQAARLLGLSAKKLYSKTKNCVLPSAAQAAAAARKRVEATWPSLRTTIRNAKYYFIARTLREVDNNIAEAARLLRISEETVRTYRPPINDRPKLPAASPTTRTSDTPQPRRKAA